MTTQTPNAFFVNINDLAKVVNLAERLVEIGLATAEERNYLATHADWIDDMANFAKKVGPNALLVLDAGKEVV